MSERPLIIKSTFYNIRPEEMEEVRKTIKKQMEEATPVVMLPCGFELAEVNVELLEKIKAEIGEAYPYFDSADVHWGFNICRDIIDNHIKELKGENK